MNKLGKLLGPQGFFWPPLTSSTSSTLGWTPSVCPHTQQGSELAETESLEGPRPNVEVVSPLLLLFTSGSWPAQQPLQDQRNRASRATRGNQWVMGYLDQLTPSHTQEVPRTTEKDSADSVSENRNLTPFLAPSPPPRRFRIPDITFNPCKLLVPPPGKDNRKLG